MEYIQNFAFFWVGEDVEIPTYLVKSINNTYSNNVNIFMLTDKKTAFIHGVTKSIRSLLPKDIMLARLKAYSQLKNNEQVIFLDADSLVTSKIKKISTIKKLALFRRKKQGLEINCNYPEYYPEFVNKTFDEMMPFLFGLIVTEDINSSKNFTCILNVAKKLPPRFHRWYGDQFALKIAADSKQINFQEFNFDDYVATIRDESDLTELSKPIVTFKGARAKPLIKLIYNKIFDN